MYLLDLASIAFVMADKAIGGKCILKIEKILNRTISIIKNNYATWSYIEPSKVNAEVLSQRIIAVLKDKHEE